MIHEGTTSATGRAPHLVHRIWLLGVLAVVLAAGEDFPFVADEKVTARRPRTGRGG